MGAPSSPRARNVTDIKSKLMQPALTSHYEVYILPPPDAKTFIDKSIFSADMQDLLRMSCSEASLPGSSLTTVEMNNDFTGVTQRHAYRRLYDDRSDFTFYVNSSSGVGVGYDQIRYFEAWLRFISGEQVSNAESTTNFYRIKYPKKYKSPFIGITKFERNLGSKKPSGKMVYKFVNAFPISISSMPVSYDSSQLLKVTVSFTYDRYFAENVSQNQVPKEPGQAPAKGVPFTGNETFETSTAIPELNLSGLNSLNISPNKLNRETNIGAGTRAELSTINSSIA